MIYSARTNDEEVAEWRKLLLRRVTVWWTTSGMSRLTHGRLTGLGSDKIFIRYGQRGGEEISIPLSDVTAIQDSPLPCVRCGEKVQTLIDGERCVECERAAIAEAEPVREACATCGAAGAVYSPKAGEFRCLQCHMKAGTLMGLNAEARALAAGSAEALAVARAECRGKDLHDPIHAWRQMSASRWRCRLCHANAFERP